MMSVIALSAPEMIILRKVLKPRLIATFVGVVAAGILLVGYLFNWENYREKHQGIGKRLSQL